MRPEIPIASGDDMAAVKLLLFAVEVFVEGKTPKSTSTVLKTS